MNWRDRLQQRALTGAASVALNQPPSETAMRMGAISGALGNLDIQGFMSFAGQVETILLDFKARLERIEATQNEMVLQLAQLNQRLKP